MAGVQQMYAEDHFCLEEFKALRAVDENCRVVFQYRHLVPAHVSRQGNEVPAFERHHVMRLLWQKVGNAFQPCVSFDEGPRHGHWEGTYDYIYITFKYTGLDSQAFLHSFRRSSTRNFEGSRNLVWTWYKRDLERVRGDHRVCLIEPYYVVNNVVLRYWQEPATGFVDRDERRPPSCGTLALMDCSDDEQVELDFNELD